MPLRIFKLFRRGLHRRRPIATLAYRAHKETTRELVRTRLAYWKSVHPFEHGDVRIKNHRRAWGSCSSKKNLNFNWRLVMLDPDLADYVILHELCHTVHLNHSREFWALLATFQPDAAALRNRLRRIPIR